jgi:hypothetical protein
MSRHSVGDFVCGETSGRKWSGVLLEITGGFDGRAKVDIDGAWIEVPARDVKRSKTQLRICQWNNG